MNTATGPPPRRRRRAVVAAVIALAAAGGVTAVLAAGSTPAASPRPAATTTTSAPSSAAASTPDAMSAWCAGPGYRALRAVHADITQMGADAKNQDLAAVKADGAVMTADAEAAEKLPPPVTHAQQLAYVEAMGAFSFAGADLSGGDIAAAGRALAAATRYLGQDQGILSCR